MTRSFRPPARRLFSVAINATLAAAVVGTLLAVAPRAAHAEGTFLPASGRTDVAYDTRRGILYISSGSSVLRYRVGSGWLEPFSLGSSLSTPNLAGIDISPDGNTLVVADRTRSGDGASVYVWVIDLNTGAVRRRNFPREFGEGGTYAVAFGSDGAALVTGFYEGSGWVPLRRYAPATDTVTRITTISDYTMVSASADGNTIGYAEGNISSGSWGFQNVLTSTLFGSSWDQSTRWFNYEIGVSPDGGQFALPTYGGTFVYNRQFQKIATIGVYAGGQPVGVAYHPFDKRVYFPWAGTGEVRAYETTGFTQAGAFNFETTFRHPCNWSFQSGRLKVSRDGTLLFALVDGGVRFVRLTGGLTANSWQYGTDEDTPLPITLTGQVGGGGTVGFRVLSQPAHGTLDGDAPNLTYTPAPNYTGPDQFQFVATYAGAESAPATIYIGVRPKNDPPVANGDSVTVNEDGTGSVNVTANDTDPEGDVLTVTAVSQPAHGTAAAGGGTVTYSPAPNYHGPDSFTYTVSDGKGGTATATVSVTVTPANDAPVAADDAAATKRNTPVTIPVLGNDSDPDGDGLRVASAAGARNGTVVVSAGGILTYTPKRNFTGTDTFTYTVADPSGATDTASVTVTVSKK